jgi:YkoY family integral membrane protein
VLVKGLPGDESKKALRWGILGAYVLRGLCLFFAAFLVKFTILKVIGGLYLCYLYYGHVTSTDDTVEEDVKTGRENSFIYQWVRKNTGLSRLWSTIIVVEIMDLIFSIDNIFASVALSQSMWVILLGVFIGIAAMRLIAGWFVGLLGKYPTLESSAYIVILLLGCKLIFTGIFFWWPELVAFIESKTFSLLFSLCMMVIFFYPIFSKSSYSSIYQEWMDGKQD